MKTRSSSSALLGAVAVALVLAGVATASEDGAQAPVLVAEASSQRQETTGDDSAQQRAARQEAADSTEVAVVYRPPRRGAPRANVGAGGVRGARALSQPLVLAPDHVGLTTNAAPSLFWYIDGPPDGALSVMFTLNQENRIEPLVEAKLAAPEGAGIQRIRLADHGIELAPNVDYEWSIALVDEDERQPQVAVSVGYLRRVARPAELSGAQPDAAAYARTGLWYDALAALGDAIAQHPGDAKLRAQRSSLLRQAQLEAAVE